MILRGSKGGGSNKPPTRTPDNLRSKDTVEVIMGVSEGPIKGLADDSAENFFLGDTPLLNASGQLNFGDFELLLYPGYGVNERIRPALGGITSNTQVGVQLANQTPVVRTGQTTNIDYLELRFVIPQLYKQTEDGDVYANTLRLKIEYKPSNEANWRSAYLQLDNSTPANIGDPTSSFIRYSGAGAEPSQGFSNKNRFETEVPEANEGDSSSGFPSNPILNQIHVLRTSGRADIYQWDGSAWNLLAAQPTAGQDFTFNYRGEHDVLVWDNPPANRKPPQTTRGSVTRGTALIIGDNRQTGPLISGGGAFTRLIDKTLRERSDPYGFQTNGANFVLTGKTTSNYVKEVRIPVERIGVSYDIRVTKISTDIGQNGDQENFIDCQWESFQEVLVSDWEFNDVACFQLVGQASDQLSGLPQFSAIMEGLECRVPSNYDPVTRVYSGVWDGLWKFAYTNNPAFVLNELNLNERWGKSSYELTIPNKWDVYRAGQFCDTLVDDGEGGQQPRYTFNEWMREPRGVDETIAYVAGTFGGVVSDDGNGQVFLRVDEDKPAVGVITPETTASGQINYSRTDLDSRVNDIAVVFKDPALRYQENRVHVRDEAHIARYGRRPFEFIAVGCRDRQEALRRGRYRLITSTTEITTATFNMPRMGWCYDLYDIVLISDPTQGTGITGRVQSYLNAGKTHWQLRDPVQLEVGVTYFVNVQIPNPNYPATETNAVTVVRRQLIAGHPTGEVDQLQLDGADIPELSEHAQFAIEADGFAGIPKPYRILGIEADEGDPDKLAISAQEVNRNKQNFIDTGESLTVQEYSSLKIGEVEPPSNLRIISANKVVRGQEVEVLELHWDRSNSRLTNGYVVRYSRNGSSFQELASTAELFAEFVDPEPGDYTFSIVTRGINDGQESVPLTDTYSFIGDRAPVDTPGPLRTEIGPSQTDFATRDLVLVWS